MGHLLAERDPWKITETYGCVSHVVSRRRMEGIFNAGVMKRRTELTTGGDGRAEVCVKRKLLDLSSHKMD